VSEKTAMSMILLLKYYVIITTIIIVIIITIIIIIISIIIINTYVCCLSLFKSVISLRTFAKARGSISCKSDAHTHTHMY